MKTCPDPAEPLQALAPLGGVWRGVESPASESEPVANGCYEIRFVLDGNFLVIDYSQAPAAESNPEYRMHGLIGWDAAGQRYFFHWYDSLGGAATDIFGAMDGDCLIVAGPDPVRGGHTRFTWSVRGNRLTVTIELADEAEKWTPAMTAEYERMS